MARGYGMPDVRRLITEALLDSALGYMSGVDLAKVIGMSRTTSAKYLRMLEADGTLQKRDMGNITLWSLRPGQESFAFPDDYFRVADRYAACVMDASESDTLRLVLNCKSSGASATRLILDAIIPTSDEIFAMYDAGKIGEAEQNLLHNIVSRSISLLDGGVMPDGAKKRHVIVIAADSRSAHVARAASAAYRAGGWRVFELGDMSGAAGVMFDLDFQRLIKRVWHDGGKKDGARGRGTMMVVVFSHTAEGLNFFADGMYPTIKRTRCMHLLLCGRGITGGSLETAVKMCDHYVDGDVAEILRWSETRASHDEQP